jgi:hypothetical protein
MTESLEEYKYRIAKTAGSVSTDKKRKAVRANVAKAREVMANKRAIKAQESL